MARILGPASAAIVRAGSLLQAACGHLVNPDVLRLVFLLWQLPYSDGPNAAPDSTMFTYTKYLCHGLGDHVE